MPSIGNIVVKRITQHRLLPPVYEPIVKHAVLQVVQEVERIHHALPSLIGAGGESPKPHKEAIKFITQNVTVGAGTVNRVKVSGVVGISYTQTSYTFTSYTIAGIAVTRSLAVQTVTITEPLSVQRRKTRRLFEDSPQQTDLSATLTIKRTKVRALTQTTIISESLTGLLSTARRKTLTQNTSIGESVAKLKASKRSAVETVTESGDVTKTLPGITRALSESVSILENLQGEVTHAGGINITKSLSDTTSFSELITRRVAFRRTLAQSIALAESLVKVILTRRSYSRSFTQLSYSSLARAEKALSESVAESHTVRMTLTKKRSVPVQSVSITEQIIRIVTGARPADIVPVSDEVERTVGRSKVLGDSVIISDELTTQRADVIVISDQVTRIVGRSRSLSQSVTIIG